MKGPALYHLLQMRARKMQEHAPSEPAKALSRLQSSLKISYQDLSYTLTWQHEARAYSLELPNDAFDFHVAGDTPAAMASRDPRDYRADNWLKALDVWLLILERSGLEWPRSGEAPELGLAPQPRARARTAPWALAPALAAGACAWIAAGPEAGLWTGCVAALLVVSAALLNTSHRGEDLSVAESLLVCGGCLVPLAWGVHPGWLAIPLAGSAALCGAERLARRRGWPWLAAGILCGLAVWSGGPEALISGLVLAAAVLVSALAAPNKVPRVGAAAFISGVLLGALAGSFAAWPHPAAFSAPLGAASARMPVLAAAVCLYGAFLLWWTHGSLFHVMPWFCILGLAVLATLAAARGNAAGAALSGYGVLMLARVFRAASRWK